AAAAIACFSFATAIALLPTALALIALRRDLSPARRLLAALPWLLATAAIAMQYRGFAQDASHAAIGVTLAYSLNFLGAGIARFATDLAPWIAAGAIALAAFALARSHLQRACLPWIGLAVF